jgi:hypothetical protein
MNTLVATGIEEMASPVPTTRACAVFRPDSGMNSHARAKPDASGRVIPPNATARDSLECSAISRGFISIPARSRRAKIPTSPTMSMARLSGRPDRYGTPAKSPTATAMRAPARISPTEADCPIRSAARPSTRAATTTTSR